MSNDIQISASSVGRALRSFLYESGIADLWQLGPRPEPWQLISLNPQPLPPVVGHFAELTQTSSTVSAIVLAEVQLRKLASLGQIASLFEGATAERAIEQGNRLIREAEELCPRPYWPHDFGPFGPIPQPRPPRPNEDMTSEALVLYGAYMADSLERPGLEHFADSLGRLANRSFDVAKEQLG